MFKLKSIYEVLKNVSVISEILLNKIHLFSKIDFFLKKSENINKIKMFINHIFQNKTSKKTNKKL